MCFVFKIVFRMKKWAGYFKDVHCFSFENDSFFLREAGVKWGGGETL